MKTERVETLRTSTVSRALPARAGRVAERERRRLRRRPPRPRQARARRDRRPGSRRAPRRACARSSRGRCADRPHAARAAPARGRSLLRRRRLPPRSSRSRCRTRDCLVGSADGSVVATLTPGATTSGLTRPSYARPVDENAATGRRGFARLACARARARDRCRFPRRSLRAASRRPRTRRTRREPACPRRARRCRPAGAARRGARPSRPHARRCGRSRSATCPAGTSAARPATRLRPRSGEVRVEARERRALVHEARARRASDVIEPPRRQHAGQRQRPVEHDVQPAAKRHVDVLGLGARVGRADGQRSGRAAGAGDASERRAGGAVVSGGDDDERVETERSVDGACGRVVRECRVRRRHSDERDARGVMGVAVGVRVDRALEPGDQLVRARVEGEAAAAVRLPAGDADRQDRRAARDPVRGRRPAVADEDARHLRAVPLDVERTPRRRLRASRRRSDRRCRCRHRRCRRATGAGGRLRCRGVRS